MPTFEIRFYVETESEADARDLCEALNEAFRRAKNAAGANLPHIVNSEITGRQVAQWGEES